LPAASCRLFINKYGISAGRTNLRRFDGFLFHDPSSGIRQNRKTVRTRHKKAPEMQGLGLFVC